MKKKTKVAAVALGTVAVLTLGASLAYFTDRADTNASGTAGTVAIDLNSDIDLTDEEGKNILNPGDERSIEFDLTNKGNKSIDVRETIVLEAFEKDGTTPKALTDVNGQAQYELYKIEDVEINYPTGFSGTQKARPTDPTDANYAADLAAFKADGRTYGYRPISGKTPLVYRDATAEANGKITYFVGSTDGTWNNNQKSYTLNGSSTEGKSQGVGSDKAAFDAAYTSQVTVAGSANSVSQTGEPVKMDGETFASFTARKAAYDSALKTAIENYKQANPEVDANRELEDGITAVQHADDYVLVFRGDSDNAWQSTVVKLSYLAEAKQHRNTGAGWAEVQKKTIQFGEATTVAVPAVNEDNTVQDLTAPVAPVGP